MSSSHSVTQGDPSRNEIRSERGVYLATFVALLLLLALTVVAAHFHLGRWSAVIAISIATAKLALIGVVFMHLRHDAAVIRLFSLAGLFWLALLLGLMSADYQNRNDVLKQSDLKAKPRFQSAAATDPQ